MLDARGEVALEATSRDAPRQLLFEQRATLARRGRAGVPDPDAEAAAVDRTRSTPVPPAVLRKRPRAT